METNREEPQALYRDFQELPSETLERASSSSLGPENIINDSLKVLTK